MVKEPKRKIKPGDDEAKQEPNPKDVKLTCGLVIPISDTKPYPEGHWKDVRAIIQAAINMVEGYEFEFKLVSEADDVGVIQKRIIKNLFENDLVICDVSSLNPNVMFELGMRLAADKPTILIKDKLTEFRFDTSPIEHVQYESDLRHPEMEKFKIEIGKKIVGVMKMVEKDKNYSPFLREFTNITPQVLGEEIVPVDQYYGDKIDKLETSIASLLDLVKTNSADNHSQYEFEKLSSKTPFISKKETAVLQSFLTDNLNEKEPFSLNDPEYIGRLRSTLTNATGRRYSLRVVRDWSRQVLSSMTTN